MKLFEEIELRLSDAYQRLKKKTDRDENAPFISEEELYSYDLALEHYKQAIQAEYDKLCPKPSEFPEGYEWCTIDSDEMLRFWDDKPELRCSEWIHVISPIYGDDREIPLGMDWRLCRWSIEDAKRIHGEDE